MKKELEEQWRQIPGLFERGQAFLNMTALREIEWSKQILPTGVDGAVIPYALCALTLPDPVLRAKAIAVLCDIEHNDSITKATRYTTPFLLQLAINPEVAERAAILEILLAVARAEYYQPGAISIHPLPGEEIDPVQLQEAQAPYHQIGILIIYFVRMLDDPDADIRRLAGAILDCYPEREVDTRLPLERAFQQEKDEQLQAIFLHDLCCLMPGGLEGPVKWLEIIRNTHPGELTRLVATLRLPCFTERETRPEIVDALIAYLDNEPEHLRQLYEAIPDDTFGHLYADIIQSLSQCDTAAKKRAIPALLRQYRHARQRDDAYHRLKANSLAEALVQFAFPLPARCSPYPLTQEQQDVVKALCEDEQPWHIWRWSQMLKQHKLPGTRDALLRLTHH
ncbi:MAG: hypothetical protein J2P37_25340 [Ktedonobacteraceae bacterium]|nr:hypothetical protein [Ktedonobacteraceae bacterium]